MFLGTRLYCRSFRALEGWLLVGGPASQLRVWTIMDLGTAFLLLMHDYSALQAENAGRVEKKRCTIIGTHGIPPAFRDGVHLFIPPTTIGPLLSLSGHAIPYRWRSLPRVRQHRASSPQGSSRNGFCLFRFHHGKHQIQPECGE